MEGENNQAPQQNNIPQTLHNNTVMAVLSYIGPLVIVSYLTSKNDPFVKFHIKQGLVVFGIEVLMWVFGSMLYSLATILSIIHLATVILSIIGIINAVGGKEKELPVVGGLAKNFNI